MPPSKRRKAALMEVWLRERERDRPDLSFRDFLQQVAESSSSRAQAAAAAETADWMHQSSLQLRQVRSSLGEVPG